VIHSVRKTLYASQIAELLDNPSVDYVTFDAPLRTFSDLKPFLESGGVYFENAPFLQGYKGSGINVAIVDSGIGIHSEIAESRIVGSVDFTRGWPIYGSSGDPYGHGTAVAGIVGAGGENYQGVAPEVGLVDVKVIDENGQGRTSNLILALEWIYNIRYHSGIRVVNLSLGHPPYESYKDDPLGQAVEKLVRAGIVVVASAGNLGRLEGYPYIWGAISSPGNHPSVITVYPVDSQGTATHTDDRSTSYGSRGPTYKDNLFKPDLSAPGHRVPVLLSFGSKLGSNPQVSSNNGYGVLNGASMATAFVSGAAALMLDINPYLTPDLVKMILLLSAVKLEQPHILEQGNGMLNTLTAVRLAARINAIEHRQEGWVPPMW